VDEHVELPLERLAHFAEEPDNFLVRANVT
jgi:hypothetical protein